MFPDTDDFGRVFRNNAVMSAHGNSADHRHHGDVRGGRRISAGDVRPRADDRGQRTVSRRAGAGAGGDRAESTRPKNWAARRCTAEISGTVDFREPDDESCIRRIRSLVEKMGQPAASRLRSQASRKIRCIPPEEMYGVYRRRSRRASTT